MKAAKERRDRRRDLVRMAVRLHERLTERSGPVLAVLPETKWRECQRLVRLHEKAVWKGWLAAAERVRPRVEKALRDLQQALAQMLDRRRQPQQPPSSRPSLADIYVELVGLFEEFDEIACDLRQRTISVVTEPVILDGVYLGPFKIELDLYGDEGLPDYSVSATDPNPAACDEEVVHPHVRDGDLCAGEGVLPIRRALEEGRVGDLFQIVNQVLRTYNPGSAYVELADWDGEYCAACGESVTDDELVRCWASGESVCCECAVTCAGCDHDFVPDRTEVCEGCDEPFCKRCLDGGLCDACERKAREEEAQRSEAQQEDAEAERQPAETAPVGCGERAHDVGQPEPVETALAR